MVKSCDPKENHVILSKWLIGKNMSVKVSVKLSAEDEVDTLTTEQLEWLSGTDPHYVIEHIARRTIFDPQSIRLLLELGSIKAQEILAEKSKSD